MQKSEVGYPGVIRVYLLHLIFFRLILPCTATITKINSLSLMAALASVTVATFRVSGRQKRQSKQRSRVHEDLLWRKVPKFVRWYFAYSTLDKIYFHVHTWFAKRARKWIYFSRTRSGTIAVEREEKKYWGKLTVSDMAHHKPPDLDSLKST